MLIHLYRDSELWSQILKQYCNNDAPNAPCHGQATINIGKAQRSGYNNNFTLHCQAN